MNALNLIPSPLTSRQSTSSNFAPSAVRPAVPLAVKWGLTLFMAIFVPVYWWNYGPTNFLYFCDMALFVTLAAVWTENALLASMAAVGILIPQAGWVVDFLCGIFGYHPIGLTAYMFDPGHSLFLRGLSLFHGWLPFLLLFLVARLGYDRRALPAWTVLAWTLMLVSYIFLPAPANNPLIPVNVDYVYGFSDTAPQHWMNQNLYFMLLMTAGPLGLFVPTHLLLKKLFKNADGKIAAIKG